jgi:hypothetical protein
MNLDWNLKSESHVFSEIVEGDVVNVQPERSSFLKVPNFQFGFFGGLGVNRNFSNFSVGTTIRHSLMTTPVKVESTNGSISKTSIMIIISKK